MHRFSHLRVRARLTVMAVTIIVGADIANAEGVHWINDSGQNAVTVLNTPAVFTTNFKGVNDVQVTKLSGQMNSLFLENFGAPTPGNNPNWITSFVGSAAQGTGDGTAGHWLLLEPSPPNFDLSSVQVDFSIRLAPGDHFLIADVDHAESYRIQGFVKNGGTYEQVSLAAWDFQSYSGQTGIIPDNRWPTWNGATALLSSPLPEPGDLNECLSVLSPDRLIDRITFTKLSGAGSPAITFESPVPEPGSICLIIAAAIRTLVLRPMRRLQRSSVVPDQNH